MNCLYLNARSLVHKMDELQTLSIDMDIIAVTETWLNLIFRIVNFFPALDLPSTDETENINQVEELCLL